MFQRLNGALLQTVCFGAGPQTLVAQGGWTGSWELWVEPFEVLSHQWRCIGFDHRGSGESVVPAADITVDALVGDLMAVLDSYGVERCVLAAESMGCVVALQAAAEHPERFEGLVLISAPFDISPANAGPLVAGSRRDYAAAVEAFVDACLPEEDSEHLRRWGRHILGRAEPEAAARLLEACYDVRPDLARVTMPAVVIHGERDRIVSSREAAAVADGLPDATFITMPGIGHTPTITAGAEVARIIDERFGSGSVR